MLTKLSDDDLFAETKYRIGLALRVHPRSRDSVRLWGRALDCQEEWRDRGKLEEYARAYEEERKDSNR